MKIGLLTFHSAHNYGAVLQAFATQETLKQLGHKVSIIDYRPPYVLKQRIFPSLKSQPLSLKIKLVAEGVIAFIWKIKRKRGFDHFIYSRFELTENKYISPFSENKNFDAYVMGSDQIWNIKFTMGFDQVYWGSFIASEVARKISYAASMSHYILTKEEKARMALLLKNFDAISVREAELKSFIDEHFDFDVKTVLDPTLLLPASHWQNITKRPSVNKKYVLVYSVGIRNNTLRIARSIAKELGIDVIELTMGVDRKVLSNKYQAATPEEFVGLFEYAEFVVTSSFHGTAFAIIFNKDFYSVAHGTDKDTRQKTILAKLGLSDRLIQKNTEPSFDPIDFIRVNEKLEMLRNDSIAFLENSLDEQDL